MEDNLSQITFHWLRVDDHESLQPKRLIKGDYWGDIVTLRMLTNICQGREYACAITWIQINHGQEHNARLARVVTFMDKLHHS